MSKIFKVMSFTAVMTLLRMICGFIVTKFVAIYTGPTGVALIGQFQSFITLALGITNAPVSNGIIRYTSEHSDKGDEITSRWWRAGFYWSTALYVVLAPLGILYSKELSLLVLDEPRYNLFFIITILLLPISSFGTLLNSIVNGKQQYKAYIRVGMTSTVISTLIMLILLMNFGLQGALYAVSLQSMIVGVVVITMNLKQRWLRFSVFIGKIPSQQKHDMFSYLTMALTSAIVSPISIMIVRNIIAENSSWNEVGEWQAVWKISDVYLSVITLTLTTYYLPKLSAIKEASLVKKEIFKTLRIVIPVLVLISIFVFIFRDFIILLLYTKEFYGARDLFIFQLMGNVLKIASWLVAFPMITKGRTKLYISSEIIFTTSLVMFTYLLVSAYGIVGANMAYALNFLCYLIFVSMSLNRMVYGKSE